MFTSTFGHSYKNYLAYKIAVLVTAGFTAMVMSPGLAAAQSANTDTAKAMLIVSPDSKTLAVGETMSLQVLLDTKGISVSQVDFKLKYDPTLLEVQDSDQQKAGIQIKDGDLFEVILSTTPVDKNTGTIQYSKIALSENKYYTTSGQPGKLATIDFKALKAGSATVRFDTTTSNGLQTTKVYRSSDESQVLGQVTNGDYQITSTAASVSPSPSAMTTASASPTPSSTVTSTPSATARASLSMTLDHTSLQANGKDKAQIKVSAKDKDGQPLTNAKLNFSVTGSALVDPASVTTNAQGQAMATLTAGTQAGAITINARLESDATVTASSQINSISAPVPTPSVTSTTTPKPSASPSSTATPRPTPQPSTPVQAPDSLQPVGPVSLLGSLLVSLAAAYVLLNRKQLMKKTYRNQHSK